MEEREYQTYRSLFSNMSNFMYVGQEKRKGEEGEKEKKESFLNSFLPLREYNAPFPYTL